MTNFIDLTGEADDNAQQSIEIESDSEDEDLKIAIAMSLQDQHVQTPAESVEAMTARPQQNLVGGLAGLDRKAMEAERLARLKRKRGVEEDESKGMVSLSRPVSPPPARKQATSHSVLGLIPVKKSANSSDSSSNPFCFPNHKVLLTSHPSRHTSDGLTAVSMRDIISAPRPGFSLKSVLLSSFIADFDWLLPHFDTRSTSFVIILHAQSAQHRQLLQSDFAGVANVRLVLPQCMGGSGNMHSKVMLLFFKSEQPDTVSEICRIVITSANLTPTDWGVGNVMENIVFVIDVPKQGSSKHKTETQFERKFKQQLRAMEVPDKVVQKLESFDLTATEKVNFVSSVSQSCVIDSPKVIPRHGALQGLLHKTNTSMDAESTASPEPMPIEEQARVGLLALSDAVSDLGLSVSKSDAAYPPKLDFITSSLGNLSTAFVRQLYAAVCGTLNPETAITKKSKSRNSTIEDDGKALDEMIQNKLRIFFPSDKTVRESKGGPTSAGTICFQQKWWDDNDIIRNCLYDCIGARGDGILMHSKIFYVRFNAPKTVVDRNNSPQTYIGYAYLGSANLSESAWGRITYDARSKQTKLTCRNWESGIIIPVRLNDLGDLHRGKPGLDKHASDARTLGNEIVAPTCTSRLSTPICTSRAAGKELPDASILSRDGREDNRLHPTSLAKAKSAQPDQAGRFDHRQSFQDLPLSDVFSSVAAVPIRDAQIERVNTPWFFRD